MRIRVITRNQAVCLALSLFLAVFGLGLALGFMLSLPENSPKDTVEAFAAIEGTPLHTAWETATPLSTASSTTAGGNLFAFDTPTPAVITTPTLAQPPSETLLPSITPGAKNTPTPTPAPGEFKIEVIRGPSLGDAQGKKKILIYHTHTYEAYEPTSGNAYEATEKWRTKDDRYNVVRVGDELAKQLTAAGFIVVHDTNAYEPPELSSSYARSLKMLEGSVARGETYDLYIDLHRDAYSTSMANHNTVQVGDQKIARLMMLIGKGTGQTGVGFDIKPNWEKNMAFASVITNALNEQVPELCRPVDVKTGRFNQHVAACCILVEVGNNRNTLEEALASIPYLSDAIRAALNAGAGE